MSIEEIWPNNAYRGLWGEVVEADIYRIKKLQFIPDVVFDLGANVGTFSKFASELFPNAKIIAVEPDRNNIDNFKKFNLNEQIILIEKAIGIGKAFRDIKAINGSQECYLSEMLGYEGIEENSYLRSSDVETILLDSLEQFIHGKYILKIDVEGSETALFTHEPSKKILKNADYIAIELHYFSMTSEKVAEVKQITNDFLESLQETHHTELVHPMFYATKKC